MNESASPTNFPPAPTSNLKIAILFGLVIALIVANVYLYVQLDALRLEVANVRDAMRTDLARLQETSALATEAHQKRVEMLQAELEQARRQAALAAGQAKEEASRRAEELAKQLAEEQQRFAQVQEQVRRQLSEVAQQTQEQKTALGEVSTKITETQSELQKTVAQLRKVVGDLGIQSGLIATNAKELAALKALGERNYYEFDIRKTRQPVRVADIGIRLKKTDRNKGRFTIDVIADDRVIEKKDRTINEPLQFYVSSARQPYEIVVNVVEKDRIIGYLATPKVKIPREAAPATGGATR